MILESNRRMIMSVWFHVTKKLIGFLFFDEMHVVPIESPYLAEGFRIQHDFDSFKSYETVTFIRTAINLIASL